MNEALYFKIKEKLKAKEMTLARSIKHSLQFSVMVTSHISFSRVISSWSATTNTLHTNSTFKDSVVQRKRTIGHVNTCLYTVNAKQH